MDPKQRRRGAMWRARFPARVRGQALGAPGSRPGSKDAGFSTMRKHFLFSRAACRGISSPSLEA